MKTQNIIALILVILIVAFLLINILLKFFKERIDKAIVKLVEDYIKINMDIDKFYETYGEDAQLKTKDLKDEMDEEFHSVVYDLINFIF